MAALDYSQQVPAADRALSLLEVLSEAREGLTTAELLEDLGGSRSGLYALLNTLRARGYVVTAGGHHEVGPALARLLPERPQEVDMLVEAFRQETESGPFDETVALTWPDREGTVVVAERPSPQALRVVYQTGEHRPPGAPDALLMAAGQPGDDPDLRSIRQAGSASTGDREVLEVAVPICADGVRPTAALVVGIPVARADSAVVERTDGSLRRLAALLSHRLGALTYQPYGWAATEPLGPSQELDADELDEFLRGLWGAQLACIRTDGTPHVVPLWYEWDGTAMWLAASPGASWRAYVSENPQVSLTLDEPWPPLRRAFLTGLAVDVTDDEVPGGVKGLVRRLSVRYLGQGADERAELTDTDGWGAVRIVPERLHGRQGLGLPVRGSR